MADTNESYFRELKKRGLSAEREQRIIEELHDQRQHRVPLPDGTGQTARHQGMFRSFYDFQDLKELQGMDNPRRSYEMGLRSVDELLERDKLREKDGFPRKIKVGKLVKPGKGGKNKVVIVPTTVEEKFIHSREVLEDEESGKSGGTGDGEEGEVIGEQPVRPTAGPGSGGAGEGDAGQHDIESDAYDLGKVLTEKFELPNLQDKGKKRSLTRYTYDLTDRHRGFGQILDKKATLREIVETNIHLGNIPDVGQIDPSRFIIAPDDKIYRVLSREKDYESQAMVFFVRDYSGSMAGKATEIVVSQHVLIYSWLTYQYENQVESRFILHDTEAREVEDFYTYYNSAVAGGTRVASGYRLVNAIVEQENLARDYNIYIFHGTDGDDWDSEGREAVPELKKMVQYSSRIGITIAKQSYSASNGSEVENYLKKSKLLEDFPKKIRQDVIEEDADEKRLIEGIKQLISE
ncbi:DUF444 family protein [bacterium]|nr:DUF444 family protein [bacterium]